jgi:S1-C subfamily serine protease
MSYPDEDSKRRTVKRLRAVADLRRDTHGSIPPHGLLVRILLISGLLCALLVASMGDGKRAHAAALDAGNDPMKIAVDLAKPAVVRIYTTVSGHLIVHFPTGDVLFPRTGGGYALRVSGSGTFISAHGDILTADHVIRPPSQVFADVAAVDVTNYINQQHLTGTPVTVDQVDQALQDGQLGSDVQYNATSSDVYLSTDYTGPLNVLTLQDVPSTIHQTVDRIETESAFNQEDLAIIHASFDDTPSVPLGDSSTVQAQDELTILGFPGNGDVSSRPTNLLTSSVNTVIVSALKTTESGVPVIQVGGNVEHGDSGGPALDSGGTVVGIVSFGLSDGSPGATSFLQASASAQTLVQTLHLDTTPGTFEQEWSQALTDYYATTPGHWHKAAQELVRMAAAYSLFQAVAPYLTNAQTQARTEHMPLAAPRRTRSASPSPWIALPLWVWTAATLVLLLLLVIILLRRPVGIRSKRQRPALALVRSQARQTPASSLPQMGNAGRELQLLPALPKDDDRTICKVSARVLLQPPSLQPSATLVMSQSPVPATAPDALRLWPCEHLNRPKARFCCMCGEPAARQPFGLPVHTGDRRLTGEKRDDHPIPNRIALKKGEER